MHIITILLKFNLLFWAFQEDKLGTVLTRSLFYVEEIRICISHPEMILNTDYFMLLFIKNLYYKTSFPAYLLSYTCLGILVLLLLRTDCHGESHASSHVPSAH